MADVAILKQSIPNLEEHIANLLDVRDVTELLRAERGPGGAGRIGVVQLLNARAADLLMDGEQLPQQGNVTREPLLGRYSEGVGTHAIERGTVEQTRPPNKMMWFKQAQGPAMPRPIAWSTIADAFAAGATDYCPDCGRGTCGVDTRTGRVTGDPNACTETGTPRRSRIPFARCPIESCGRRIWDMGAMVPSKEDPLVEAEPEEGEIRLDMASFASVEERLRARLTIHLLAFHQEEARIAGIRPLPTPDQVVAQVQSGAGMQPALAGG